jgi:hypothetical protein
VAVAVNPVTTMVYGLSNNATDQISVINGTNHTFTTLTPPGTPGAARVIAVNPVTNKIYAAFASALVVVDGATNAMTVIPAGSASGGPVAIGINVLTNVVYVPNADGTMLVLDATTGTTSTIAIASGANAVAVDPLANMVYVLDSSGGVTPVTGAAGSATATGITTTITRLAGDSASSSGSITLNAASSMSPAPLDAVRKVYFRIGNGAWTAATGSGPYSRIRCRPSPPTASRRPRSIRTSRTCRSSAMSRPTPSPLPQPRRRSPYPRPAPGPARSLLPPRGSIAAAPARSRSARARR